MSKKLFGILVVGLAIGCTKEVAQNSPDAWSRTCETDPQSQGKGVEIEESQRQLFNENISWISSLPQSKINFVCLTTKVSSLLDLERREAKNSNYISASQMQQKLDDLDQVFSVFENHTLLLRGSFPEEETLINSIRGTNSYVGRSEHSLKEDEMFCSPRGCLLSTKVINGLTNSSQLKQFRSIIEKSSSRPIDSLDINVADVSWRKTNLECLGHSYLEKWMKLCGGWSSADDKHCLARNIDKAGEWINKFTEVVEEGKALCQKYEFISTMNLSREKLKVFKDLGVGSFQTIEQQETAFNAFIVAIQKLQKHVQELRDGTPAPPVVVPCRSCKTPIDYGSTTPYLGRRWGSRAIGGAH